MSVPTQTKRITVPEIRAHKGQKPVVMLTCYHAHTARLLDSHCDFLLVGDSLGMVMHGYETTVPVPLELMIMHGRAVVRGTRRALVVVDMPFGSYEESPELAFRNASRILKETGCQAVKLEGGARMAETIRYLSQRGIPVVGHIGMTPQNVQILGGFKTQGRTEAEWPALEADAKAVAGVEVSTTGYSSYQFTEKNQPTRWRVAQTMNLEGSDFATLAALVTRLQAEDGLVINGMNFGVSPEARRKAEDALTQQAIKLWQVRAQNAARGFGYEGWRTGRVTIQSGDFAPPRPMYRAAAAPMAASAPPVSVEGGNTDVTVSVSGEAILDPARPLAR